MLKYIDRICVYVHVFIFFCIYIDIGYNVTRHRITHRRRRVGGGATKEPPPLPSSSPPPPTPPPPLLLLLPLLFFLLPTPTPSRVTRSPLAFPSSLTFHCKHDSSPTPITPPADSHTPCVTVTYKSSRLLALGNSKRGRLVKKLFHGLVPFGGKQS